MASVWSCVTSMLVMPTRACRLINPARICTGELCVEVRERLIHREHPWPAHKGSSDRALALPAGELARPTGEQPSILSRRGDVVDALFPFAPARLAPSELLRGRCDGHLALGARSCDQRAVQPFTAMRRERVW